MIAVIAATGLGRLHTRLDLPEGDCEILGESEAGKSLLVEVVCAVVFGRASDGGAVDPGLLAGERADLEVGFAWGDTLRRPITAKGIGGATLISMDDFGGGTVVVAGGGQPARTMHQFRMRKQ